MIVKEHDIPRQNVASQRHRLQSSLVPLNQEVSSWLKETLSLGDNLLSLATQALSPKGPGTCDLNKLEKCVNCVTSIPYTLCGVHTLGHRKTQAGRLWGYSLLGVGACSCAFHGSSGRYRPTCRRLDYWGISVASSLMLRAAYPSLPAAITTLSMALTPFKPFVISTFNTTAMEVKYLRRARQSRGKPLQRAHRLHLTACLIGLGCFTLEELVPQIPLMHASWHCLSATATLTINNLLADVEANELK